MLLLDLNYSTQSHDKDRGREPFRRDDPIYSKVENSLSWGSPSPNYDSKVHYSKILPPQNMVN